MARLLIFLFLLSLPSMSLSATHYVCGNATDCNSDSSGWSTGANSGTGTTKAAPWATLTYATANMLGGDTLIVGTSVYTERLTGIPAGSAGAYTTIQAEILHGPEIRYGVNGYQAVLINSNYVVLEGFKVNGNGTGGDALTGGAVLLVSNANHVKVLRNAIWGAANTDQSWVMDINQSDTCLAEENWVWGLGRYKMGATASNNIILRRNVARHDYAVTSIQCAPFINYDAYNTIWQNNIVVDSDPNNQYCSGHMYGAWYFENKNDRTDGVHSTKNTLDGNIVIQNGNSTYGAGWYARMSGGPWTINNMIIYNQEAGLLFEHGAGDAASASISNATIGHITGTGYDQGNGDPAQGVAVNQIQGDQGYVTNTPVKNSIFFDCTEAGIGYSLASNYNAFYANTADTVSSAIGANSITTTNPLTNGLTHLPRILAGSALKTAGEGGAQMGAEVMYKLGVSGTLYGETGWNTLTTDPLWPFPNEALIKTDMASYSGLGPAGARGFAATGNGLYGGPITLTSYIWEQLGNAMPSFVEMYPDSEINGACGSNSGGSFYSLTSGTSGNCATGTVASFTGSGPWTWGCDGSGGGTSTAADACSASLLTDTTDPTITAFTMPATATSTTVSVSLFTATDDVAVTGYCITTINDSSGCSWSGSAPSTATGAEGANTFYAWARDAALNVSAASTDTTTITLPECTYYVRPDGNNGNTGTTNTSGGAWLTIQNAVLNVSPGDTVCVADGTYAGFNITVGGTNGSPITYRALGTGANIASGGPVRSGDGINIEDYTTPPDYVTIDGFNVYNQTAFGIRIIAAAGIVIQNCTIHDNGESGILSASTPGIQILNNTAYENGDSAFEHNVYLSNAGSDNCIVRGNHLYSAGGGSGLQLNGDWLEGGDGFIDNALIEDNIIHGNAAKGMSLISVRYATIKNNIVYGAVTGAAGIHIVDQQDSHYSIGNTVVNNTIDESNVVAVRINNLNTGNVIFNNVTIGGVVFEGSDNYESNNLTTTTGFTNYSGHDYSLTAGSDKINAGLATYQSEAAATDDYLGTARPQGAAHDVGAHEFIEQAVITASMSGGTCAGCTITQ